MRMNFLLFGACLVLAACDNPFGGGDCVSIGVFGINVTVADAVTKGAPTSAPTVVVTEGAFTENAMALGTVAGLPNFAAAAERPGTYRVVVSATGYQDYSAESVRVVRASSGCKYLQGVKLTAELRR